MTNPLDLLVANAQIRSVANPLRTTVNPLAQQLQLAAQSTTGETAAVPAIVTEPVIVTRQARADVADNIEGGSAGQIPVQTAANRTGFITAAQAPNRYLFWNGTSIEWSALSTTAVTGSYTDLINRPNIFSGNYSDLSNKPTLFSGAYDDLTGKPVIPAAQVNSDWNSSSGVSQILNKPTIPAAQVNSDWNASSGLAQILNKPTLTTGNIKTLAVSGQTSVVLAIDGTLTVIAGNAITLTTDNTNKTLTIANNRNVLSSTAGSTFSLDCTLYNSWRLTLTPSTTTTLSITAGKNPPSGQEYEMRLYVTYAASSSLAFFSGVIWPNGIAPTLTATAAKTDVFAFTTLDGGTTWYGIVIGQNW